MTFLNLNLQEWIGAVIFSLAIFLMALLYAREKRPRCKICQCQNGLVVRVNSEEHVCERCLVEGSRYLIFPD